MTEEEARLIAEFRASAQREENARLRDEFAGKAMQGMCGHPDIEIKKKGTAELIAAYAYEQADAMLKARAK